MQLHQEFQEVRPECLYKEEIIRKFEKNKWKMNYHVFGDKHKLGRIISHIIFWLFSVVLFSVLIFYTRNFRISAMDFKTAVNIMITILLLGISVYINLLWLLPVYFARRRFFLFTFLEVLNIALFICLNYLISMAFEGGRSNYTSEMIAEFILVLIFLVITTLIKFTRDSMALQVAELKIKEVERQNIESELQALKAQFNPHFFFNTLNSIYSLSLDKSNKVPELILKLSELMRYVLYDTRDDCIPIRKQLGFLESYIYLEKLRTDENRTIELEILGEHQEVCIAPLLLEPFVENAFKHGARDKRNHPFIRIKIDVTRTERVIFMIDNNKDEYTVPQDKPLTDKGIGLTNVKKRLELLYPGKHRLQIYETPSLFRVELTIELNEN
jgi:two-component system, LytTR family, sensor kinase